MSRKDFRALAAALKSNATLSPQIHRSYCEAVADVCARTKGRFDRARFLTACGVEG